eukprot:310685-Pleurochrysis_carterae.AAC.2
MTSFRWLFPRDTSTYLAEQKSADLPVVPSTWNPKTGYTPTRDYGKSRQIRIQPHACYLPVKARSNGQAWYTL